MNERLSYLFDAPDVYAVGQGAEKNCMVRACGERVSSVDAPVYILRVGNLHENQLGSNMLYSQVRPNTTSGSWGALVKPYRIASLTAAGEVKWDDELVEEIKKLGTHPPEKKKNNKSKTVPWYR